MWRGWVSRMGKVECAWSRPEDMLGTTESNSAYCKHTEARQDLLCLEWNMSNPQTPDGTSLEFLGVSEIDHTSSFQCHNIQEFPPVPKCFKQVGQKWSVQKSFPKETSLSFNKLSLKIIFEVTVHEWDWFLSYHWMEIGPQKFEFSYKESYFFFFTFKM